MDWCAPSDGLDAVTCGLRARQCGSHVQATGDAAWAQRAGHVLGGLLAAPGLTAWSREACPAAAAAGICNLLTAPPGYSRQLWDGLGARREAAVYEAVQGGPAPAADERSVVLRGLR